MTEQVAPPAEQPAATGGQDCAMVLRQLRHGLPISSSEIIAAIEALEAEQLRIHNEKVDHFEARVAAESEAAKLRAVVEAAHPFADFVRPLLKRAPLDMQLTAGSSMAGRQLTVRDFAELAAALDRLGDGEKWDG